MSCSYRERLKVLKAAKKELLRRARSGMDVEPYLTEIKERIDYYTKLSKKVDRWP
jgi:hypothetical protein